jgi:hypothetical protein
MTNRVEAVIQKRQRVAEKTKTLISLLRDPELKEFVSELVGEQPVTSSSSSSAVPTNGSGKLPSKVTPAVRVIAADLPSPFTIPDVVQKLEERKFNFHGRQPSDAARDAVYLMVKNQQLFRLAEQGKGGKPNTYEKI